MEALIWLTSSAGIVAVAAFSERVLERWSAFQHVSAEAKMVIAIAVAVIVAIIAHAAATILASNDALLQVLQPYILIVQIGISMIAQQIAHGANKEKGDD